MSNTFPASAFPLAYHMDMETARAVQGRLFPCRQPRINGIDCHGESRPAGDVGGDFFDFHTTLGGGLVASIGDVSGHGVSAAILMSALQAFLRGMTLDGHQDLWANVERLNRCMYEISPDNTYATLFYARVDPVEQRLNYVNAGHEAALLVRSGGRGLVRLESTGTVIGMFGQAMYGQRSLTVDPGDKLVLFTDGISDAESEDGGAFGEQGVLRIVAENPDAPASGLVTNILDAVEEFTERSMASDDRTVVVIQLSPLAARASLAVA